MFDLLLGDFPFSSLWNVGIFLFLAFSAVIYLFLLPQEKGHSIWKTIAFLFGLIVIFTAAGSPLNIIGRIQFRSHILQVILLCFIAPPFLLVGMKRKLIDDLLSVATIEKIYNWLTKPVITVGLFFLFLYTYHHPPIFDQARGDLFLNYFYLLGLFITAMLLWIPIISKKSTFKRTAIYSFVCMVLLIPLGVIFLTAKEILYSAYTDLTTFSQALQVCLPPGFQLSPEDILLLLPFDQFHEQFLGGITWLVGGIFIFALTIAIKKIRTK